MIKSLLKTLMIVCLLSLSGCDDKDDNGSTDFSKILIGEWKIRLSNYDGYGGAWKDYPPIAWKKTDGIYFKYEMSRVLFRQDGTYSITLDTLCTEPGFSWDTVAYTRTYSVSGNRIKGLFGDHIFGKIKKKGLKNAEGEIIRDSIYLTGSVSKDSVRIDEFKDLTGTLYVHNEFKNNTDCSIITDKFVKSDTIVLHPWIYIRIEKLVK